MLRIAKNTFQMKKYKGLLGLLPALLFMVCFFIGGTLQSLYISFSSQTGNPPLSHHDSFWAYKELANSSFAHSLGVTTGIALLTALLAGMIGLFSALFLAVRTYRWKWLHILLQLPMGIPHLFAAYILMQVFMQSGWYSRIAFHLGIIDSLENFPIIIHDDWGVGVILAYLWKEVPFIVLLIYPFILKLLSDQKETSASLGASLTQTVLWVIVPILLPIWVGGMWVVFAFTLGAYEIPALLARTSFGSVPVMAWQEYSQFGLDRQPIAIAMNLMLAVVSFITGIILIYLQLKWYKQGRRVW
ncbi:MAG TPA: ABC transporter permease subunit [Bacillales bacterium]|nr:ABC transporter permease subunit [Bacillales bacterium]